MKQAATDSSLKLKNLLTGRSRFIKASVCSELPYTGDLNCLPAEGEVNLLHISQPPWPASGENFTWLLSPDEKQRAYGYIFGSDADRFRLGRGMLRLMLARFLGVDPSALMIKCSAEGKPFLPGRELSFSISYSDRDILLAFAKTGDVGVDIERINQTANWKLIADAFFPQEEAVWLDSLPPDARATNFFRLWTVKEAIVKALGSGLTGLEKIAAQKPADLGIASAWQLEFDSGYIGALAMTELCRRLKYYKIVL